MSLYIRRTAIIVVPGHGRIKIVPRKGRGRLASIDAPESLEIVDRKGRPMVANRKRKRLTDGEGAG